MPGAAFDRYEIPDAKYLEHIRGRAVRVRSRRAGTRGEYEGVVDSPTQSGTLIFRSGRLGGPGAKVAALRHAREWALKHGLKPVEG